MKRLTLMFAAVAVVGVWPATSHAGVVGHSRTEHIRGDVVGEGADDG